MVNFHNYRYITDLYGQKILAKTGGEGSRTPVRMPLPYLPTCVALALF